jgi:hypothetical protein
MLGIEFDEIQRIPFAHPVMHWREIHNDVPRFEGIDIHTIT